jgi:uncharacterized protein (TIGR02246 family)
MVLLATAPGWAQPPKENPADKKALRELHREFVTAYNKGDAAAVAACYAPDADFVGIKGETHHGRADIEKRFASFFAQNKGARLKSPFGTLRFITSEVAISDRSEESTPAVKGGPDRVLATVVYVKRDGKWLQTSVRLMVPFQAAAGTERTNSAQQELQALQGTWTLENYEYEGKRLSRKATIKHFGGEDRLADIRIEGDKISWVWPDRSSDVFKPLAGAKPKQGTYSLDPKKSPKTVDIHYLASGFLGGQSLGTLRGIYRLRGDRLEVCCRFDSRKEDERPKDFTTDDNDADRLLIYKRVKAK